MYHNGFISCTDFAKNGSPKATVGEEEFPTQDDPNAKQSGQPLISK